MVRIEFKNGKTYEWGNEAIKETKYDGKCFIVVGADNSIGIYNIDGILAAETTREASGNVVAEDAGNAAEGVSKKDPGNDGARNAARESNESENGAKEGKQ